MADVEYLSLWDISDGILEYWKKATVYCFLRIVRFSGP